MVNEEPQIWRWCHEIRSPSDIVAILVCVSTFSDVSTSYNFLMINFSEYIPTIKWYMTIIIISYKFIYIYIYVYKLGSCDKLRNLNASVQKDKFEKLCVLFIQVSSKNSSTVHLRCHQLYTDFSGISAMTQKIKIYTQISSDACVQRLCTIFPIIDCDYSHFSRPNGYSWSPPCILSVHSTQTGSMVPIHSRC
jgi:hypothetical protein